MESLLITLPWESSLAAFALVLRAGAFMSVAPVVGAEGVPVRVRFAFALLLVILLAPVIPPLPANISLVRLVFFEVLVGLILGFAGRMVLNAALFAGGVASFPSGLALANELDPVTQINIPALGVFYRLLAVLVYLAIGGHRQLVTALVRSYEIVPPGTASLDGPWAAAAVSLTGRVILLGVRIAAPVIVSGLLVDTCMMLVARAVPQMQILIVGAPVRLGFGLLAVGFSLQVLIPLVRVSLNGALGDAYRLLGSLAGA